jgi:hypothetical protein
MDVMQTLGFGQFGKWKRNAVYIQYAKRKNAAQCNLGSLWQLKSLDQPDRQDNDDGVGADVVSGVCIPEFAQVNATAMSALVVGELDR